MALPATAAERFVARWSSTSQSGTRAGAASAGRRSRSVPSPGYLAAARRLCAPSQPAFPGGPGRAHRGEQQTAHQLGLKMLI
jgi:hypothetical protein